MSCLQKVRYQDCFYCQNYRCCIDHCCNWENCDCKDCQYCGNPKIKNLLSEQEKLEFLTQNNVIQQDKNVNSNNQNQKDIKQQEKQLQSEENQNFKQENNNKKDQILKDEEILDNFEKLDINLEQFQQNLDINPNLLIQQADQLFQQNKFDLESKLQNKNIEIEKNEQNIQINKNVGLQQDLNIQNDLNLQQDINNLKQDNQQQNYLNNNTQEDNNTKNLNKDVQSNEKINQNQQNNIKNCDLQVQNEQEQSKQNTIKQENNTQLKKIQNNEQLQLQKELIDNNQSQIFQENIKITQNQSNQDQNQENNVINNDKKIDKKENKNDVIIEEEIINKNIQNISDQKKQPKQKQQLQQQQYKEKKEEEVEEEGQGKEEEQEVEKINDQVKDIHEQIRLLKEISALDIKNQTKEKAQQFYDNADSIQKQTSSTIEQINKTLEKVNQTLKGVQDTNESIKNFEDTYQNMNKLVKEKIYQPLAMNKFNPESFPDEELILPEISDIDTVANLISTKQNIVIITGEAVSYDFKETMNKLWESKLDKNVYTKTELLTTEFLEENNEIFWNWYQQEQEKSLQLDQNCDEYQFEVIKQIAKFQKICQLKQIDLTVGTLNYSGDHIQQSIKTQKQYQNCEEEEKGENSEEKKINFDYFDENLQQFGFYPNILEIGGNIRFVRCSDNNCEFKLYQYNKQLLNCPKCNSKIRPHLLFYDDKVNEQYNRIDTFMSHIQYADCLIMVGLSFKQNVIYDITSQAISNNALLVDINENPQLEIGNIKQLIGNPDELGCDLFQTLINLFQ